MSRWKKNLNDFPKWVEENADLAKGTRVFGVDISEEMTKKELMAIIGYLIGKNQNDTDKHKREMDFITVSTYQCIFGLQKVISDE